MKNKLIKVTFAKYMFLAISLYNFNIYASEVTNSVLNLTGSLSSQAVINVTSNKTQYMSGSDSGIPGLPGVALNQSIMVDVACTNGMLIELLLNSLNNLSLRSSSAPQLKIPYQISIANPNLSNVSKSQTVITAAVVCNGNTIQLPINITTGNLPYGLSAGSYQDVLLLNLSY